VIEDNKADVFLIREALETQLEVDIDVIGDGEQAAKWLGASHRSEGVEQRCPDLFVLDINLPKRSGHEILTLIRSSACAPTLVVVVTSSGSGEDRERMIASGANAYFRKPSNYDDFMKLGPLVAQLLEPQ
jgi:chemotaxis family two-component system response regulator Rcp1